MIRTALLFSLFSLLLIVPFTVRAAECSHEYSSNCDADCNICGEERTPPHTYNGALGWRDGGEYHYIPCADCEEQLFSAPHDSDIPFYDKENHGTACSICGAPQVSIPHNLTLSKGNSKGHKYSCSDCDYSETEAHSLTVTGNSDGHVYACECGYASARTEHSYESPCERECTECGYMRIPPHKYEECTVDESGHFYECTLCGYSPDTVEHEREYTVNSLGHFSVCTECGYDFGFENHTASDGSCPCGYIEVYFRAEGEKNEYAILLWVLIGASAAAFVTVAVMKRRRIVLFFKRIKRSLGIFRK